MSQLSTFNSQFSKKVALSGGIGSGKTCMAKIFTALGVPVYNSDECAKQLMQTEETIRPQLIMLFGEDLYKGKELQKQVLAQYIFSNNDLRQKVNAIVHPVVIEDYKKWSAQQNAAYTIMETALLFENDLHKNFDITIYVTAPLETRIARVMKRDNCERADVEKRIKMQQNDTICVQKADFVIENNNFALSQVLNIHEQLLTQ
ncbi:MAG: dephospho-CoA kinase [Bacteroidales bacterium]|jgi:dephospho-CoA kinase|nr:dephospho-CoA kinase [Bacteroidales bacterium]